MKVNTFVLSAFQQNTRVVACEATGAAICIDPGAASPEIVDFIRTNELSLQAITLTHGHLDHVGGTGFLHGEFPDTEIIIHADDEDLYNALTQQPLFMGLQPHQLEQLGLEYGAPPPPTRYWEHGEIYKVGDLNFEVRHCPGHTRGHVVLAETKQKHVFVGDCLFEGSIGRTDLPGGSFEQLMSSIEQNILSLGDDFVVHSGHGRETTVGHERKTNPFLTGAYSPRAGRFI
ncbi:MAG: MBL fold metallo-hydrolase [Acidobacteriota bacterium]